jgi:AraC family transcriptional regulator
MLADVHILHRSDFYRISDFKCHCDICSVSEPEYNDSFCISFIRKGFFEYRTFRRNDEVHVGRILLSKPDYEHTTRHIDQQPDITTVFEFNRIFLREIGERYGKEAGWFFLNKDIHSILLNNNAETEYLHYNILKKIRSGQSGNLEIDELVIMLLEKVILILSNSSEPLSIEDKLKQHHLVTAESARDYLQGHFAENISLQQLAQHCCVSPFHFSRIFKSILQTSPHQYLSTVRLQHAKILLSTSELPVTDIAFECGFNSLEHFITAFKKKFKASPGSLKKQLS